MTQYLSLGVIVNTHNLKGEVRLISHYPEYPFNKLKKVLVRHYGQLLILELEKARPHKKFWLIKFKNYNKVEDVAKFKGEALCIESVGAPRPKKGEFYFWEEIIGCEIFNHRKERYGKIVDILPSSGHPVYVVETSESYEKMVPAAKEFIQKIDRKKKKVFLTEAALPVLE